MIQMLPLFVPIRRTPTTYPRETRMNPIIGLEAGSALVVPHRVSERPLDVSHTGLWMPTRPARVASRMMVERAWDGHDLP